MLRAVDDKLIEHFIKAVEDHVAHKRAELARGSVIFAKDTSIDKIAADYAYRVGYLKAVDEMLALLEQTAEKVEGL